MNELEIKNEFENMSYEEGIKLITELAKINEEKYNNQNKSKACQEINEVPVLKAGKWTTQKLNSIVKIKFGVPIIKYKEKTYFRSGEWWYELHPAWQNNKIKWALYERWFPDSINPELEEGHEIKILSYEEGIKLITQYINHKDEGVEWFETLMEKNYFNNCWWF